MTCMRCPGSSGAASSFPRGRGSAAPGDAGNMRLSGHGATHRTAREDGLGDGTPAAGTKPPGTPTAGTKPPSLQAFPFLHLESQRQLLQGSQSCKAREGGPGWLLRLSGPDEGEQTGAGAAGCLGPHLPARHTTWVARTGCPPPQSQGVVGSLQQVQRIAPSAQCERPGSVHVGTCSWRGAHGSRCPGCTEVVGTAPPGCTEVVGTAPEAASGQFVFLYFPREVLSHESLFLYQMRILKKDHVTEETHVRWSSV